MTITAKDINRLIKAPPASEGVMAGGEAVYVLPQNCVVWPVFFQHVPKVGGSPETELGLVFVDATEKTSSPFYIKDSWTHFDPESNPHRNKVLVLLPDLERPLQYNSDIHSYVHVLGFVCFSEDLIFVDIEDMETGEWTDPDKDARYPYIDDDCPF